MSRRSRLLSSTGIYHIILRSVNQQIIFEEDADYQKFLFYLSECKQNYDFDIYAYCLMSNHIHLLLSVPHEKLKSIFQSLGTRFVRWYNQKYDRFGHLFQSRYWSNPVENLPYFTKTLVYIHNNPVKAKICRYPSDYRWSSCSAYYGAKNPLINTSYAFEAVGSKDSLLKLFSQPYDDNEDPELYDIIPGRHYRNKDIAFEIFQTISGATSPSDIQKLPKSERNKLIRLLYKNNLTLNQIALFCGLSKSTIFRICHKGNGT